MELGEMDEELGRLIQVLCGALEAVSGLRWAYLFGSAARGAAYGDVDVAVMPEQECLESILETGRLASDLSEVLATGGALVRVDVVDLRTCSLPFIASVLEGATVILDRVPAERRHWEADSTLRWLDFEPTWSEYEKLRMQRLRG